MYKCRVSEESEVKPLIRVAYSKITKGLTAKEVTQEKNQEYLFYILRKINMKTKLHKKASRKITPVERLGWESINNDSLVIGIRKASIYNLNSVLHNCLQNFIENILRLTNLKRPL